MAAVRRQKDEDAAEASPAAPSKKLKTLVAKADESRYKVGVAYTQAALDAYTAVLRCAVSASPMISRGICHSRAFHASRRGVHGFPFHVGRSSHALQLSLPGRMSSMRSRSSTPLSTCEG